jgi:hypothetical protein
MAENNKYASNEAVTKAREEFKKYTRSPQGAQAKPDNILRSVMDKIKDHIYTACDPPFKQDPSLDNILTEWVKEILDSTERNWTTVLKKDAVGIYYKIFEEVELPKIKRTLASIINISQAQDQLTELTLPSIMNIIQAWDQLTLANVRLTQELDELKGGMQSLTTQLQKLAFKGAV